MKTVRNILRPIFCIIMVAIVAIAGYNIFLRYTHPQKYTDYITKYANQNGIEPSLVSAVIKCESGFDKEAVSAAGARGLMQLTEETFCDVREMLGDGEQYTYELCWNDPEINIEYGTFYLAFLLQTFGGDVVTALASYNAGMSNVKQWMGEDGKLQTDEIKFEETRNYVEKVLEAQEKYIDFYS